MAYTASSFAAPLVGTFRLFSGVHADRAAHAFATHAFDPVLDRLLLPAWGAIAAAAGLDALDVAHSIARFANIDSLADLQAANFDAGDFLYA